MSTKPSSKYWKYYSVNQSFLSVLINEKVWFAHPDRFNDPFDCNIDFDCVLEDLKVYEPNDRVHNIVKKWLEPVKNDESGYYVYSVVKDKYDEVLMWSHYADEHRGICLGLSLNSFEANTQIDHMGDVLYRQDEYIASLKEGLRVANEYERGTIGSDADAFKHIARLDDSLWFNTVEKRLRTKAPNWSYENEFRFIIQGELGNNKGDCVKIRPDDITSIIYGLKCEAKNIETIENILRIKKWRHVTRWRTIRGSGLFDLEFKRITDW